MNLNDSIPSSTERALAIVRGELSSGWRWAYRLILLAASVCVAAILSLWTTEPGPLPLRLHVAFATLICIGSGWICVLTWILTRRNCPTALDRLATAWMATIACSSSLAISVPIALLRGNMQAALYLGVIGFALLCVALSLLRGVYRFRAKLKSKLSGFEASTRTGIGPLVLLVLLPWIGQASGDDLMTLEKVTIQPRIGMAIPAESGRLKVPMNRSNPDGPAIEIAFIRVRSVAEKPGPATFILAGGPGDSGVQVVRGMFMGGDQIRSVLTGDIIGIDQRGAGASKPSLAVTDRYGFSLTEPGDPEKYRSLMKKTCQEVALRLRRDLIDLSAFNTIENADDIDALRENLGYERVNLWGTSYGSQLAMIVLRRHESGVERVLVSSPVGPNHLWKRPAHIQNCLERISKDNPRLLKHMGQVIEQLNNRSVHVDVPHPLTGESVSIGINGFDVQIFTWFALGRLETTQPLPGAFEAMSEGDFTVPARWLIRFRLAAGVGSAMNHVMDAASGCSHERQLRIAQEADLCLLGDVANFFDGSLKSVAWDVPQLGDKFRRPFRSSRPVLVLCGEFDAKTPIENAREILADLPDGHLGIITNEGHGFRPRPDVVRVVASFFRGEALPPEQRIGD